MSTSFSPIHAFFFTKLRIGESQNPRPKSPLAAMPAGFFHVAAQSPPKPKCASTLTPSNGPMALTPVAEPLM
jgi:hypothetical protein